MNVRSTLLIMLAVSAGAAYAQTNQSPCPPVGSDTTCGVIITVTDAGASVALTGQGPYDSNDDTLIGVINNSTHPLRTLHLSSVLPIFGFDGDGIDTFGISGNSMDDTGYGGPNAYYTNVSNDGTSGTVNFIIPIPTGGGTGYFSLEAAISSATTCAQILNNGLTGPTGIGTPTISASFLSNQNTPLGALDLITAANYCGFTNLDWQQTITNLPGPSPFFQIGNPTALVAPPAFLDPPQRGYTYEPNGDNSYPFYYDPNNGELDGQSPDGMTLNFSDTPADPCLPGGHSTGIRGCSGQNAPAGSVLAFTTHLVGINADGTATDTGIGFTWQSTYNGTSGGTATTKNSNPVDPGSGTGGITVLSVTQTTTYNYNGISFGGANALQFVPATPCRIIDTRGTTGTFGGPSLAGGSIRTIPVPTSACNIPASVAAYSFNVTVVPKGRTLGYLTVWPTGQSQPLVSTLNSPDGSTLANAAIVPAGTSGSVNVFVTDATDLIIDINGYFTPPSTNTLQFYPLPPCRVLDTRNANAPFGGPSIAGGASRSFTIPSSACHVPTGAASYSFNVTAVPHGSLGYITAWPTGQAQPTVSTLNSLDGSILANAAIVPAGTGGAVSFYASNTTDLIVDINGYFAAPNTGGLNFYTLAPCRLVDTRNPNGPLGGPIMAGGATRTFPLPTSSCGLPATAAAYSLNMTVVPQAPLGYLTLWPAGQVQPLVSTLNAPKGLVIANAAIVPAGTNGSENVFVTNGTHVIVDTNGYFGQ
ncbi:MAG TPA: hypothetical protein VKV15_03195 [Bryobacteraceae bacterium]|nr:hypothetical protein [Bryobacteraceae bacterium]